MKKLVIFDFDGTLMNTLTELQHVMNQSLKIHNLTQLSLPEYKQAVNGNIDQLISNILKKENTPENIEKVKNTYLELIDKPHENLARPFEGMHELLRKLQDDHITITINSNRFTDSIREYTNKYFKDINFFLIEGHNPPNPSKPDAYGVNQILDKTKIDKKQAVYIGDSSTDIQTAKNAGIDCIIVDWGYSRLNEIEDEYVLKIVKRADEIYDIL